MNFPDSMQKPKAVVFDLGKVLLDFDYSIAVASMLEHCAVSEAELLAILNQSELLFRYETGHLTTTEFFEEVRRRSSFKLGQDHFEPLFGDIFKPIPEMIALNQSLRAAGIATYIFSNTNEMAVKHIRAEYPFFADFTAHILSYEHRAMKPSPAIYEVVERQTGASGPEILYIDDRQENVEQGAARGWRIIHHSSEHLTVPRVKELTGLA